MRYLIATFLLLLPYLSIAQFGAGKPVYNSGGGYIPQIIQAADLDGDGDADILLKEMFDRPIIWVANDGAGNFSYQGQLDQSALTEITSLKAFDFDKDGDQDVVAAFSEVNKIYLWKNNGNGSFSSPLLLASNLNSVWSIEIVDINHDGNQDIVVARPYDFAIWIKNDLTNNQWSVQSLSIDIYSKYLDVLDFNGDGSLDYLSLTDNSWDDIFLNGKSLLQYDIGNARFIKAVDLDRDGDQDLVAAVNGYNQGIIWLENKGDKFAGHVLNNSSNEYKALTIYDYDADGDEDIFASCGNGCGTHMFENIGAGRFNYASVFGSGAVEEQALLHVDLNGDKIPDLVKSNSASHTVYWFPNNAQQFTSISSDFIFNGHCQNSPISFSQAARGKNIQSWQWDFGDGSPVSNERSPMHTFTNAGTFSVRLKVTNTSGQNAEVTKSVTIVASPIQLPEKEFPFCTNWSTITLDPAYSYQWFNFPDDVNPLWQKNSFQVYTTSSTSFYIIRTDTLTGCNSIAKDKITARYYGPSSDPKVTGAVSYSGPSTLMLQANGQVANESVEWYTDANATTLFNKGNYLTQYFSKSTTYFVRTRNAGGCTGTILPISANILSQPVLEPKFVWGDGGKSDAWTEATSMALDGNGNPALFGLWTSGRVIAGNDTLTATGYGNNFLIKYNQAGQPQSAIKVTSGAEMNGSYYQTLLIDHSDNIFLTGTFSSDRTIGGQLFPVQPGSSMNIIAKLSPTGSLLWYEILEAGGIKIKLDDQDNFYVSGNFSNGAITVGGQYLTGSSFLAKYNNAGQLIYAVSASSYLDAAIACDKQGNTYWGGIFEKDIAISGTYLSDPFMAPVVAKFDATGNLIWMRKGSTNLYYASLHAMEADSQGNLIFACTARPFDSPGILFDSPIGVPPGQFVTKLFSDGSTAWVKRITGAAIEDMSTASDNSIYLVGSFSDQIVFDSYVLKRPGYFYSFVAKLDPDGNTLWAKSTDQLGLKSIEARSDGTVFVAGAFKDQTYLDNIYVTSNAKLPAPYANYNMLIAKIGFVFNADFKSSNACAGKSVSFLDASTTAEGKSLSQWTWNFGDGATSSTQNPTHSYSSPGTYTVSLTVKDNSGQTTMNTKLIVVGGTNAPKITLQPPSFSSNLCSGESINYQAQVQDAGSTYGIHWYFDNVEMPQYADKSLISFSAQNSMKVKAQAVSYDNLCASSRLTADSINQIVFVIPTAPVIQADATSACIGKSVAITSVNNYPYYKWSDGETTKAITATNSTNLSSYTLTVGETPRCMSVASQTVTIIFNPLPVIKGLVSSGNTFCVGQNGMITAEVTTGAPSEYQFTWLDGASNKLSETSSVISKLAAGNYSVTATNLITKCASAPVQTSLANAQVIPVVGNITVSDNTSCGSSNGNLQVTSLTPGQNSDYQFTWRDALSNTLPPTGSGISGLAAGNYSVTATNLITKCVSVPVQASVVNAQVIPVVGNITASANTSCESGNGGLQVTTLTPGQNTDYQFTWRDALSKTLPQTGSGISGLATGNYSVTATNLITKCTSASVQTAVVNAQVTPVVGNITASANTSCRSGNGSLQITSLTPGQNSDYQFTWRDALSKTLPQTGSIISGLAAGNYSVTATNLVTKCTSDPTQTAVLNLIVIPVVGDITVSAIATCGLSNGSLDIMSVTPGQNSDYTFVWYSGADLINGVTDSSIGELHMGDYSVIATNNNTGCVSEKATKSISCVTGLEKGMESGFQIYPNPAGSEFHLVFSNLSSEKATLSFTDVSGKVHLTMETFGSELAVSRGAMTAGLYIVKLNLGEKTSYSKLILN